MFIIVSVIFGRITTKRNKLQADLLANGMKLNGVVEKVYLQRSTQYGKQSPYRIEYTYTYQDKVYHHKSCFIWEKPNLVSGDCIMVYANELGESTLAM